MEGECRCLMTAPCLKLLNRPCLPNLEDALAAKVLIFVRRCIHGRSSVLFRNFYVRTQSDRTRGADPKTYCRYPSGPVLLVEVRSNSIGAILWNKLPPMICCLPCHAAFLPTVLSRKHRSIQSMSLFLSVHQ